LRVRTAMERGLVPGFVIAFFGNEDFHKDAVSPSPQRSIGWAVPTHRGDSATQMLQGFFPPLRPRSSEFGPFADLFEAGASLLILQARIPLFVSIPAPQGGDNWRWHHIHNDTVSIHAPARGRRGKATPDYVIISFNPRPARGRHLTCWPKFPIKIVTP
jgi:hypothetical protein